MTATDRRIADLETRLADLRRLASEALARDDRAALARCGRDVETVRDQLAALEVTPAKLTHQLCYPIRTYTREEIDADMAAMATDPEYQAMAALLAEEFRNSDQPVSRSPASGREATNGEVRREAR